ncbi:aminotransferase class I/II-fold pyridoxal phosphate-dependent enzyme [Paralcaligenes sp. KSB-10]|uniref:aminotransferase class I/II-fold pyridoxal phosphate-dependent enzyme n=1 Tax=Paralcaligenes sp. KSB-10 TaxID=2901142 RepID=UPI001E634E91|nr:aminotransferase class I/II-fold pyridoxal phosphate-dependent enzyme [Paralcaligenes sp. KSB-10]UHL65279.1 aminotransferase class I/II-fold pyridoxal phosphate-dependent enzyme [Paralcaligenes sp. KSB-10]
MTSPNFERSLDLAVLDGTPAFPTPIPCGQAYFPAWGEYEHSFRELFERQYYTNQGPLTNLFELQLAERLQVRHVVCVTNGAIGLSMVAEALELKGRVVVPSFGHAAASQSLRWSNLTPVFCDVDRESHAIDLDKLKYFLDQGASAVLPVNLWGGACDAGRLEILAHDYGIPIYFDSAHSFGSSIGGRPIGGFGRAEVFSFNATNILNTTEGGCIATSDDLLAERLRNIRSSYGVRQVIPVSRTANGRMSEAQAAMGLLSLKSLDSVMARNRVLHNMYCRELTGIPGLKVFVPRGMDVCNYQYLICEIDECDFGMPRGVLRRALQLEGIVTQEHFPPMPRRASVSDAEPSATSETFPVANALCVVALQLPLGAWVEDSMVSIICSKIRLIQQSADAILRVMER